MEIRDALLRAKEEALETLESRASVLADSEIAAVEARASHEEARVELARLDSAIAALDGDAVHQPVPEPAAPAAVPAPGPKAEPRPKKPPCPACGAEALVPMAKTIGGAPVNLWNCLECKNEIPA